MKYLTLLLALSFAACDAVEPVQTGELHGEWLGVQTNDEKTFENRLQMSITHEGDDISGTWEWKQVVTLEGETKSNNRNGTFTASKGEDPWYPMTPSPSLAGNTPSLELKGGTLMVNSGLGSSLFIELNRD